MYPLALSRLLKSQLYRIVGTNAGTTNKDEYPRSRTEDHELAKERSVLKIIYEIVVLPCRSWRAAGLSRHIILKVTAGLPAGENYFPDAKSPYEMRRRDRQTAIPTNTTKEKQHTHSQSLHCR